MGMDMVMKSSVILILESKMYYGSGDNSTKEKEATDNLLVGATWTKSNFVTVQVHDSSNSAAILTLQVEVQIKHTLTELKSQ